MSTAENTTQKPAGNGCPRGCLDPSGEDCKASLISPCPQGRYQGEETWLSANDGCSGCGGLDGECYCGEDDEHQALIAETIERDDDPVNEFDY